VLGVCHLVAVAWRRHDVPLELFEIWLSLGALVSMAGAWMISAARRGRWELASAWALTAIALGQLVEFGALFPAIFTGLGLVDVALLSVAAFRRRPRPVYALASIVTAAAATLLVGLALVASLEPPHP